MRNTSNSQTSTYRSRGPRRAWPIVAIVALIAVVAAAYALTSSSGDLASADEGAAQQEATQQEATEQEAAETEETAAEEATEPEDEEQGEGREEEADEEAEELRERAEAAARGFLESLEEQREAEEQAAEERAEAEREAEEQAAEEQAAAEQEAEEQAAAEREAEAEEVPPPEDTTLSMTVPSLGLEGDTVRDTDSPEALHEGAIKLPSTGYPWQEGANTYIAAHRIGYPGTESHNQFFDLPAMQEGDAVFLTDANGTEYEYQVTEIFAVSPTDTWVTEPIPGRDMVTLQTCTDSVDDWWSITPRLMEAGPDSGRLVVRADRV